MSSWNGFTTNFYRPEVILRLQSTGALIVCDGRLSHPDERRLVSPAGEALLCGHSDWISKVCETHRIPVRRTSWIRLSPPSEPSELALFQTPYGARTIANAIEMEGLCKCSHTNTFVSKIYDAYSVAEDRFIDANGCSSTLY
jgi:hypothetical protein